MGSSLRRTLLLCLFATFLFSAGGFVTNSRQYISGGFWLESGEHRSVLVGFVPLGEVIRGSYSALANIEFFIVDEFNYDRWLNGLSNDRHSYHLGDAVSFNFAVPYTDTWYAVFHNPTSFLHYVDYEILVTLIPSGSLTPIFIIAGVGVGVTIGMVVLLRATRSRRETPVTEPITEPAVGPISEEGTPAETQKDKPPKGVLVSELICTYCGHGNPSDAEFCIRCGRRLD